jgi:hypothetical protein
MYQLKGIPEFPGLADVLGTLIMFLAIEVEPRSGHLLQNTLLMVTHVLLRDPSSQILYH